MTATARLRPVAASGRPRQKARFRRTDPCPSTDKHFTIAQDMAAAEAVADVLLGHGTGRS
ncbi:hypothetical protein ACIG0C_36800 [Kitasatospora aureofaciens]|uniref:Uncharacterized protein n=1 Tax=Kitasatospora aureofaciens TaxID=1894 RepID=A0A8H9I084_KITAU|nr:hypothetical protein [Kitasatospora aureofaciens]GGV03043.1 hypothetical protein GCM10010502_67140 [Kitasatospora aureofaciens]